MRNNVLLFVRGILFIAALLLLIFTVELTLDLTTGGYSLDRVYSFETADARHFNNLLNRNLNQLVAIVFTTVAIAVPLTANMYSLKFLELFIKDPVNAAVLSVVVFANLNNLWAGYALKDNFVPNLQLNLSFVLVILCCALLFPYLYYVFRFLHPNTLLVRLEGEIDADLRAAAHSGHPVRIAGYRRRVAEGIEHIANIAIRSVDRSDRNTAIESVFALTRVARAYWAWKPQLPPAWFEADPNLFLGFAASAMAEVTASRCWVEMKLLSQMRQVMSAAVPRMHDLVSVVARSLRKIGMEQGGQHDRAVREMIVGYFNTFIRLAITRRDPRSVFWVMDQYRTFAEALTGEYPEQALVIARHFAYYGQVARDNKLDFIVEAVAYDLGTLVQHAWQTGAPNRQPLLECFLHYDPYAKHPLPGVKKAQAILASYFLLVGYSEPVDLIRKSLSVLDPDFIARLREVLLGDQPEKYWEATERRINLDYVPPVQREHLRAFFDSLQVVEIA